MTEAADEFGFKLQKQTEIDWKTTPPKRHVMPDRWSVSLPNRCSWGTCYSWDIAGERDGRGVSHPEAVAELEKFIAKAQEALESLKAERELNADGD